MKTSYSPTQLKRLHKRFEELLSLPNISAGTFKYLDQDEQAELSKLLKQKLEKVNNEYNRLTQIMGEVIQLSANRLAWENNHQKITKAIYASMCATGQMPTQTYIAEVTGLSRQTVTKHLSQGEDASVYAEQLRNFSIMAPQVLTRVTRAALSINANVPAMKLYFQLLEKFQGNGQLPMLNQNNYIQINNTVIKQEALQQLTPEQLLQIEEMVRKNLPVLNADMVDQVSS